MARKSINDIKPDYYGFTLVELVILVCVAGILVTIGVPAFSTWIPDYRLRNKAKELYADMHLAKMKAVKEYNKYRIVFSTGDMSYRLSKENGDIEKTVPLCSSDSGDKIFFGCGTATKGATKSGSAPPKDGISYNGNILTFNPRGTGSPGYAYLYNSKGTSYAVGTLSSGVIFMKKWDETSDSWK